MNPNNLLRKTIVYLNQLLKIVASSLQWILQPVIVVIVKEEFKSACALTL
jgi:hypothetical protein